ncbi:carboxypeptidase-like regulatory domain-containing protein [Limibacter armeniacum]|uniref:carboxypeptidase-like regulatory domain-containing protein n=1 Tax=Limibacter armeniacum TaxID=466084 RepID=UPI002FE5E9A8
MKRSTIALLFCCLLSFGLQAQKVVRGIVQDKEKEPIPFAHIILGNTTDGTFANEEGYFSLTIPESFQGELRFTAAGYNNYLVPVDKLKDGEMLKIRMEMSVIELTEVVVTPDDMRHVIREAIRKIPENYHDFPLKLNGFFRGITTINEQYAEYTEAILDIYEQPIQVGNDKNQYKVIKARSFADSLRLEGFGEDPDSLDFDAASPHEMLDTDLVRNRGKVLDEEVQNRFIMFLDSSFLDYYHFEFERMTTYQGRSAMLINFSPRWKVDRGMFTGQILLDEETKAFAMLDFEVPKRYLKKVIPIRGLGKLAMGAAMRLFFSVGLDFKLKKIEGRTEYQMVNGKWYPKYIKHDFLMYLKVKYAKEDINIDSNFGVRNELFVLSAQADGVEEIPEEERLKKNESIKKYMDNEDTEFWKRYNVVSPTKDITEMTGEF